MTETSADVATPAPLPLPQGEIDIATFNVAQFDRMNTFRNMIKTVYQAEKDQKENAGKAIFFGLIDTTTNKVKTPYMLLDSRYRATINETADHMYNGNPALGVPGFSREEKEIANFLIEEVKQEYEDGPPAMSAAELVTLFERSPLEVDTENPHGDESRTGFDYEHSEGEKD